MSSEQTPAQAGAKAEAAERGDPDFLADLRSYVGSTGAPLQSRDPVNEAAIRTWCDAMAEANPYFTDPATAESGPHGGLVAPPAMLNVWPMQGLDMGDHRPPATDRPESQVYRKLEAAGFTGVVATNSDLHIDRYLRPGDVITATGKLVEVTEQKQTRLGTGHWVTTEVEYTDQNEERVGALRFNLLKYAPPERGTQTEDSAQAGTASGPTRPTGPADVPARPPRPRPKYNQDHAWFWQGLTQRELRIQRFTDDGTLIHPPANANPNTQGMEWDWIVASGQATLYSYTVVHHPKAPAFDYPHIVGLVELEEGVRMITNIVGVTTDQLEIGMELELCFAQVDDPDEPFSLHQFRPAPTPRATTTLTADKVSVGDRLPLGPVPVTALLVVSTALATRDFQPVHHDRDIAQGRGSKDIFMNILTTTGIVGRWIGDWAGDDVEFENIKIGLGVPNYVGDLMVLSGSVTEILDGGRATVGFIGRNSLGAHVTGTADIVLPTPTPAGDAR